MPRRRSTSIRGRLDYRRPLSDDPLNRGLVAWWKVCEVPGCYGGNFWWDLVESAKSSLNSSAAFSLYSGSPVVKTPGSTGSYVGLPSSLSSGFPLTVHIVFTPIALSSFMALFDNSGRGLSCFLNGSGVAKNIFVQSGNSGPGNATLKTALVAGVQMALTIVLPSSTSMSVYQNGLPSVTQSGTFGTPAPASLHMGDNPSGGGTASNIAYSSIRIFNNVLSAAEIAALYQDDLQGNPRTLRRRAPTGVFFSSATGRKFRRTLSQFGTRSGSRQVAA